MTTDAIENVVRELKQLPDSEQSIIVDFLRALRRESNITAVQRGRNPAVKMIDGLLVFTGEAEIGSTDWLQVVREEREADVTRDSVADAARS